MENYGKRVQYSVFECHLSEKRLNLLYKELMNHMEKCDEEDSIRIYYICRNCIHKHAVIGISKSKPEEESIIIV